MTTNGPTMKRTRQSGGIRRGLLAGAIGLAALVSTLPAAMAQAYPTRPIRLVIPFPAGGATDLFARAISVKLAEKIGQPVVVENHPGAGGVIGSDIVAKAAPDGYTLLLATSSTHSIGPSLNPRTPFDVVKDFTPIVHVGNAPSIMLVPNSSPARTLADWITSARKNAGKWTYASSGNGTVVQLTAELLEAQAGLDLIHVPYKGTAQAIPDVISGQVDMIFDSLPTGLPHVREGRLRALAVTSATRTSMAPDLPTVAELLPGFESNTWFGLYGPRNLPADIRQKVNAATNATLAESDVKDKLARLGIEPVGGTPEQLTQMVAADTAKWKKIIVDKKIVPN